MLANKSIVLIVKITRSSYSTDHIRLFGSTSKFRNHQQIKIDKLYNDEKYDLAKPFSQIPGPSKLEMLTGFLPGGKYYGLTFYEYHKKIYNEYGVIAKFPGIFGKSDIVYTFDPINIEKVFRTAGVYPKRQGLGILKYFRGKIRPDIYNGNIGILLENGERWANVRYKVNQVMLSPKIVKMYVPRVDAVSRDFVKKIRELRDHNMEMPNNFGTKLGSWALEATGVIAFDHRLGVLLDNDTNPEAKRIIESIQILFDLTYKLDVQPSIWKYYKTKQFRQLMDVLEDLLSVTLKYIDEACDRLQQKSLNNDDRELSILEKLIKVDRQIAILMVSDMIAAGIDTTASTAANMFYFLAKNPEKQDKLREEIIRILPEQNSPLTIDSFNNVPYLRSCLKETMRLQPIVPGTYRITGQNIVLSNFQVPKGINVGMGTDALHTDPKYFPNPNSFIPERWINKYDEYSVECPINSNSINPFVYLPFGYGVRTCIGKRLAEIEVQTLLARIIRDFKIEWNYGPLKFTPGLVSFPIGKLKFKFTDL